LYCCHQSLTHSISHSIIIEDAEGGSLAAAGKKRRKGRREGRSNVIWEEEDERESRKGEGVFDSLAGSSTRRRRFAVSPLPLPWTPFVAGERASL